MAVRVADSLKQQNDLTTFPIAYGEDLWLDKNKGQGEKDYKSIQELFDSGELGGGGDGLPTPEAKDKVLLTKINGDTLKPEWQQVDKGEVGMQLPEFESLEEWDSLPADEKSKYYNAGKGYVVIKEDVKGAKGVIDDTKPTSTVTTLSAKKINDSFTEVNVNLGDLSQLETTEKYNLVGAINEVAENIETSSQILTPLFTEQSGNKVVLYKMGKLRMIPPINIMPTSRPEWTYFDAYQLPEDSYPSSKIWAIMPTIENIAVDVTLSTREEGGKIKIRYRGDATFVWFPTLLWLVD